MKQIVRKTERLLIAPMTEEETEAAIAREPDPHLTAAYTEMLTLCREHPEDAEWYANWGISLRDGTLIGSLGFKGSPAAGEVEIGYGIELPYRYRGYAEEAIRAAVHWAFRDRGVDAIIAETETENRPSQNLLVKLGFRPCGMGEEGPRYRLTETPLQ